MSRSDHPTLKKGWLSTRLAPNVIDAEASEQDSGRLRERLARERTQDTQSPPTREPRGSVRPVATPEPAEATTPSIPTRAKAVQPDSTERSASQRPTASVSDVPDADMPSPAPNRAARTSSASAESSPAAPKRSVTPMPEPAPAAEFHAPAPVGDGMSLVQADFHPGPDLSVILQPESERSQAYRRLFTRLSNTINDRPDAAALAVVAAQAKTGRSSVAANLAVLFARAGMRVMLIDADLRKGDQERQFGYRSTTPGLSGWLQGTAALSGLWFAELPGLVVVPAGRYEVGAAERISHPAFRRWIDHQRQSQQVVILDTGADDDQAQAVAAAAGGAVMVCRRHQANLRETKTFTENMEAQRVRFLGAVLVG